MALWTASEVKERLHLEDDEGDTYIDNLVDAAQTAAENYCRVTFDNDAPEDVRDAILLLVAHRIQYRDESDRTAYDTTMKAFQHLLTPYRDPDLMF